MTFFDSIELTKAAYICSDLLQQIAACLSPVTDSKHMETKEQFLSGINSYDHKLLNKMLEDAMCRYLHVTFLPEGIKKFCNKYNIPVDFSQMTTEEIILTIDKYKPSNLSSLQ